MMFPKHYSLIKEHPKHFELHDARDNKTFHIAKKDLHPASQIKVMKMQKFSDGGSVGNNPPVTPNPQQAKDVWDGAQNGEMNRLKSLLGFGQQQPKKYADGGGVIPPYLMAPSQDTVPNYFNTPPSSLAFSPEQPGPPLTNQVGQTIGAVAGSGLKALGQGAIDLGGGAANLATGVGQGMGLVDPNAISGSPVAGSPPPGTAAPAANVDPSTLAINQQQQGMSSPPGTPPPDQYGGIKKEYEAALGLQKQSVEGQANSAMTRAKSDADLYAQEQKDIKAYGERRDTALKFYSDRNNEIYDRANKGEIDPDQYWTGKDGKGAHSRVSAAIGIILGGLGAGLQRSTTNMALEAINKGIDRNIDAQKTDINKQNNLFRQNMEMYHNEEQAHLATKADMIAMTAAKANQIAAKAGTSEAENRKNYLLSQLGMQSAQIHQQLATAGISRDAYTTGVPSAIVPALPADQQKRMVKLPNGYMADAGNETNAKEYNEQTAAYHPIMADLGELKQLTGIGSAINPAQKARAQALQYHIVTELNDLAKSHRISESDIGFQKGQLSDPTSISNALLSKGTAATDQLMESLTRKHEAIGSQYVPAYSNMRQKQSQIKNSIPFTPSK